MMEYRTLGNTGMEVSLISMGAASFASDPSESGAEECVRAVHAAIDDGINFFDVSPFYGDTVCEERLGKALRGKRDGVFLATKCGRYGGTEFDFSAKRVARSVDESLARLNTDYLDLLQAHDIEFGDLDQIVEETLPAMRELQDAGKCRFIGITGYPLHVLRQAAERHEVDTILTYCRYNLLITDMDDVLTPFCRERGIGLINASPLHMRLLTDTGAPDWHPAPDEVKEAAQRAAALCRSAGVSISDVAMRFCLDHPYVATVLVGMSKRRNVERNMASMQFRPEPDLMDRVREVLAPAQNVTWPYGWDEPGLLGE